MKRIIAALLILAANLTEAVGTRAEVPEPKAPELEYCLRLNVQISESNYVGDNHKGKRNVIPIVGGTFEGKLPGHEIKGEILPGGADYQMHYDGRSVLEAIYCLRTDDGINILVHNVGMIIPDNPEGYYFHCAPKFEAPADSRYDWLNNSLFLCRPDFTDAAPGTIVLDVWRVR